MRRLVGITSLAVLAGCAAEAPAPLWEREIVDLTHTFDAATIYWPTETGFELRKGTAGYTEKGYYYAANSFAAPEHGGTHVDAPIHFYEGRDTLDEIPVERLIGPGVLVDVRKACAVEWIERSSCENTLSVRYINTM